MTNHKVTIALGSNTIDREQKVKQALNMCVSHMNINKVTQAIETEPIGIDSPMFLNQMANGTTTESLDELTSALKAIENQLGRQHGHGNAVSIDIDVMQYDDQILHSEDWQKYYIKTLMTQL